MPDPTQDLLLSDSSTLINFLRVGRRDLLTGLPYRLLVVDVVRQEIRERHQSDQLEEGIALGEFAEVALTDIPDLQAAAALVGQGLGAGESFSIVAAHKLGAILGIDDRTARNVALRQYPALVCTTTQDLVLANIRHGTLTVAEADALKELWRAHHRFALKLASFADLMEPSGASE
jgi:predicted nucleic acid-binding protein